MRSDVLWRFFVFFVAHATGNSEPIIKLSGENYRYIQRNENILINQRREMMATVACVVLWYRQPGVAGSKMRIYNQ
jgi:hypothetical protein